MIEGNDDGDHHHYYQKIVHEIEMYLFKFKKQIIERSK